jgi:hypothetical protein
MKPGETGGLTLSGSVGATVANNLEQQTTSITTSCPEVHRLFLCGPLEQSLNFLKVPLPACNVDGHP